MRISKLDWDDYRIDHIAEHGVEPEEVWEVCEDSLHWARRQGVIVTVFMDRLRMAATCS